jgi:DHA1 family tetracycline resistance protein-like MFS transporter
LISRLGGERRAAFVGMSAAILMYLGYGLATKGWMLFAVAIIWLLAGLTWPSLNALLSQQIPANAQGELQGGLTCLGSLAAIVSPPMMTQLLSYASTPSFYFPGAPFLLSAVLVLCSLMLLRKASRALVVG